MAFLNQTQLKKTNKTIIVMNFHQLLRALHLKKMLVPRFYLIKIVLCKENSSCF